MLSRVADSLYWMSRYLERAEHEARLIDLNLNLTLELSPEAAGRHWRRLLACLSVPLPEDMPLRPYQVTQHLTFAAKHDALVSHVTEARENARQVREEISSEMWEQINRLYLQVKRVDINHIWNSQPDEFFRAVKEGAHLFHGITDSTLSHSDGWHFIQLGRFLERAKLTALLLDVNFSESDEADDPVGSGYDFLRWVSLLKSCSAFEAYCQFYTADFRPERILEFLLLNAEFPRSVRFAADVICRALETIAKIVGTGKPGRPERLAGRLLATLDYSLVDEIVADNLHEYLDNIQRQCALIHSATQQVYIAYPVESALAS
ncbi:MAG: alpha-E domain-containing protein [Acidobacteriota bacterium]